MSTQLELIAGEPVARRLAKLREYISVAEARLAEARAIRDDSIRELRTAGLKRAEVASMAGVSVSFVAACAPVKTP